MFWLRALAVMVAVMAALILLGPREPADMHTVEADLPEDLSGWLADRERHIDDRAAGRIEWAGEPGQRTELALVYLHGFSGSPAELRPLPQQVAQALGANLYSARLTGHGLDGAAMARARLSDWWGDTVDAVAVADRLGDRVILLGLSTGATLAAIAALDPKLGPQIDGLVLISPNFKVNHRWAWVLDLPFARPVIEALWHGDRCFEPLNEAHEQGWTSCYAIVSTLPMAAAVRHARGLNYGTARQPAFFIWSWKDRVVVPRATQRVADRWGGPVTRLNVDPGPRDDPSAHVIGGDALSPDLSVVLVDRIVQWIAGI
ncbi:alpha/beta hydrolase [Paracoccus salsus]|uniref:alpha/beta hydrolase n=1 Tax=Paracoccus salsus TaxID=2911061 RepID=UPI001F2B71ED|nr:alpha/beta hydrolase [Paracoccus salsus]MCF3973920.1 alpha/beta hydrolase [Paracoccus salsus]